MTRIVVLVSGFGWHVEDLRRAAARLDVQFDALPFSGLSTSVCCNETLVGVGSIDLSTADAVLVRMMPPGSLEQVVFRMDALHALQACGTPVINAPRAIEVAVDKFLALARLQSAGLPVPETWVGESSREALEAFEALGGDAVIKPLFGSEGRGMTRVCDRETAGRVLRAIERIAGVLYVQKFIPSKGHDLRVLVLGERILGAIERDAAPGDWRANLAQGGRASAVKLDAAIEQLALDAARAVGAHWAGVDLLPTPDGPLVLEVNAVPGWKGLAAATGIDVAAELLHELARLSRARQAP